MRFIILGLLAALGTDLAAAAQSQGTHEAWYRCRTGDQSHLSDSRPPECEGVDTEVLNEHGMVIRVIEGARTRAAREQREAAEEAQRREREARQQRDRMLIDTYLTVEDIERLRDQRLDLLDSQYRITEQNITNLRDRQERLSQQIARFKPYSSNPNAPPLPDHLAEEMVNTVNGMRVYQETLAKTRAEQAQLKAAFSADIARFKELKGIK